MILSEARPFPKFDWFLPIDGDGGYLGTSRPERLPEFNYLKDIALEAERLGYFSLLVPTRFANGSFEETSPLAETWTTVSALTSVTSKIRFLVAIRPGFISTGLFAQMASTLENIGKGRLDINVVPGGIQGDFERFGEESSHEFRYSRASEFIDACKKLWESPSYVNFDGDFIKLKNAICSPGLKFDNLKFYLGGASNAALDLASNKSDVYLNWIEDVESIGSRINKMKSNAKGKVPSFGLRTHLVVRDTEEDAWKAASDLISQVSDKVKIDRSNTFASTSMVGQQIQSKRFVDYKINDRLWNGISIARVNCGTAIVGTPEQVSSELLKYWHVGVDEFILSGFPHLEECTRVANDVLPLLSSWISKELI